jgi:hypothetical protein
MDKSLLDAIYTAFPIGVPPPRPITVHRCDECDETDRLLGGRTWTDVAADFPHYCQDTFPLLTIEAQVYYLPAYLCFDRQFPEYMAGLSVASALERGALPRASFLAAQRAAVWAWAEAYYHTQPERYPPDVIAETWWLDEQ